MAYEWPMKGLAKGLYRKRLGKGYERAGERAISPHLRVLLVSLD